MKKVLVVDFGGQYAHLIARRVRELNRFSEILPAKEYGGSLNWNEVGAIVLSGGPDSINEKDETLVKRILEETIKRRIPVLGICYGHQLLAAVLGGEIARGKRKEYGSTSIEILVEDPMFKGIPKKQIVWMSHSDSVASLPRGAELLAMTENGVIASFRHISSLSYGVQFHPEVKHTEMGMRILENFLTLIASLEKNWYPKDRAAEIVAILRTKITEGEALSAVSGGVDSLTATILTSKAIGGEKVHAVIVDTGLLREGEVEEAENALRKAGVKNIYVLNRSTHFLSKLKGVEDPESKRRIIAEEFAEAFEEFASELASSGIKLKYLVQGTIYPDRIESGAVGSGSDRIKSHHNIIMRKVGQLELVEPLAEFYKDEVRGIARNLGIPESIVTKHPFPGPGLAIRILGEVTEEALEKARKANKIVEEELREFGLYEKVWQGFAVLLPIKSVGVKGDRRSYEQAVAVRVVESEDAMTAFPSRVPWELLEKISSRIVNEVPGINRVLYDITTKPPATIEFE